MDKAAENFLASAKEGDEYAQYMVGWCFEFGYGCERNLEEALFWYKKSAEQGMKF